MTPARPPTVSTASPITTAQGVLVTLNANGTEHTPPRVSGTDTFTYQAKDSSNNVSNTAIVTITVTPKAANDTYHHRRHR